MQNTSGVGVERIAAMHRAAVIPQHEVAGTPLMPPDDFVASRVRPQFVEQPFRFAQRYPTDVSVAPPAKVQHLSSCLRMRAHDRMIDAGRGSWIVHRSDALPNVTTAVVGTVVF